MLVCVRSRRAAREVASAAVRLGLADAVHTATSEAELLLLSVEQQPDLVLADASVARSDIAGLPRRILARAPRTAILLFSPDGREAAAAVAAGARGLVQTDDRNAACLVAKVLLLLHAPGTAALVPVQRIDARPDPTGTEPGEAALDAAMPSPVVLTEREAQVLRAMADGKSNAEIGRELYLSEDTVKTHARRIFRKLGARDRAHAVAAGFRAGLVV